MKFASIILIVLSIVRLCQAQCGSQNNQTSPLFTDVHSGIEYVDNCDFPTTKFNATCVSASCTLLASSGLCPYTDAQNLNLTALNAILAILNSCFKDQMTICGTPLDNIEIPPVAIAVNQAFPGLPIGGQCTKIPNTGFFNNVQNVSFTVNPTQSSTSAPLNVVMTAPTIVMTGQIQCSISILQLFNFNLPDITVTMSMDMSPTASIDFENEQPIVQVQADNVTLNIQFGNFVVSGASSLLPVGIQNLFTSGINSLWKSSGNPAAVANFYATFIAYGIEATKANCPSP